MGGEEPPVLRLGPLAAPGYDHHVHGGQLAGRLPGVLGQDMLDAQEPRPGRHRVAEVVEKEAGPGVIPIVEKEAQQVSVGAAPRCS